MSKEMIPVTSIARTAIDLAGCRGGPSPAAILGRAERLGHLRVNELEAALAAYRGHRGVARLRLALEEYREPVFTRSQLERRFRRLLRDAALPMPSSNFFVAGYELDAYWPDIRFAVELDTYKHHGDPIAFERDRRRQEDLKLQGIELVRITGKRLAREPEA